MPLARARPATKARFLALRSTSPALNMPTCLGSSARRAPRLSEEKGGANYLTHEKHRRGSALHLRRACARLRGSVRARLIAREKINCLWAEAKNYVS